MRALAVWSQLSEVLIHLLIHLLGVSVATAYAPTNPGEAVFGSVTPSPPDTSTVSDKTLPQS